MKKLVIQIHLQALAQFIPLDKNNFSNLSEYHHYKKRRIYDRRNTLISDFLGENISDLDFSQTEMGKPYLISHLHCSMNQSHSQKHYALAMSNQMKDIGVDLEDLDRRVRFEALAQHAFHPNELQQWYALDQDKAYWFKVWTTKEAVLKASGLGIRINLKELDTQVHSLNNGGMCEHPLIGVFAYQNYSIANCALSVAWRSAHSCKGFAFPNIEIIQH